MSNKSRKRAGRMAAPTGPLPMGSTRVLLEESRQVKVTYDQARTVGLFTFDFEPGRSGLRVLDGYASLYDRYRLERLTLHFNSSVSQMSAGMVVMGVDFDPRRTPSTLDQVLQLNPRVIGTMSQRRVLTVPRRQLNSRARLYTHGNKEDARPIEDSAALKIVIATDYGVGSASTAPSASLGYITVRYQVYFEGPNAEN